MSGSHRLAFARVLSGSHLQPTRPLGAPPAAADGHWAPVGGKKGLLRLLFPRLVLTGFNSSPAARTRPLTEWSKILTSRLDWEHRPSSLLPSSSSLALASPQRLSSASWGRVGGAGWRRNTWTDDAQESLSWRIFKRLTEKKCYLLPMLVKRSSQRGKTNLRNTNMVV